MVRSDVTLTVAIAALNEAEVVEGVCRDVYAQVEAHFSDFEVLLINDGSTDDTGKIMERLAGELAHVRYLENMPNIGLGGSYKKGLDEAKMKYYMLLCGDGGLPAKSLPPIFAAVGSADIVSPYITNLWRLKTLPRYLMSKTYTSILNIIFRQNIRYYNGLPVHRVDLLRGLTIKSDGFAFQGEIMCKLLRNGATYVQVGVEGAELTSKSKAVTLPNFINVFNVLKGLISEILSERRPKGY